MARFTINALAWLGVHKSAHNDVRVVVAYPGRVNVQYHETTMEGAIRAFDTFNHQVYWPLRNVGTYLGRMGV